MKVFYLLLTSGIRASAQHNKGNGEDKTFMNQEKRYFLMSDIQNVTQQHSRYVDDIKNI